MQYILHAHLDGMTHQLKKLLAITCVGISLSPSALASSKTSGPFEKSNELKNISQSQTISPSSLENVRTTIPQTDRIVRPPVNGRLPEFDVRLLEAARRNPTRHQLFLPNARQSLNSFPGLNANLGLRSRYSFNSLSSLKNQAKGLNLRLGNARVDLTTYTRSSSSLANFASQIKNSIEPQSLTEEASIFTNENNRLALIERITYQPKFSACANSSFLSNSKGSIISSKSLSKKSSLRRGFCFDKQLSGRESKKASSFSKDRLRTLKAELSKAAQSKTSKIPRWARNLDAKTLSSLSKASDQQLSRVLANNARISRVRLLYAEDPRIALSKAKLISSQATCAASRQGVNPRTGERVALPANCLPFNQYTDPNQAGSTTSQSASPKNPRPNSGKWLIDEKTYLTGFTFGDSFYWSEHFQATIDYGVGTENIELQPFASAYYGLGVRFPLSVKTELTYTTSRPKKADLTFKVEPFNGNADHYRETGLPSRFMFDGKEIVAEAGAEAGLLYQLPVIGFGRPVVSKKVDFTSYLPGELKGGDFIPPTSSPIPLGDVTIPIDLLGGVGSYYIDDIGGIDITANPSLTIGLSSPNRGIKVKDFNNNNRVSVISASNTSTRINLNNDYKARFKVQEPYYSISLSLYPGLKVNGRIGLAGWSQNIGSHIRFPSLGIDIPSGGIPFSCHRGTICSRTYNFDARTGAARQSDQEQTTIKDQILTIEKAYSMKDDESGKPFTDNVYRDWNTTKTLRVERPRPGQSLTRVQEKRGDERNTPQRCVGGEVVGTDWNLIEVDRNGNANLYISMELYEQSRCELKEMEDSFKQVQQNAARKRGNPAPFLVIPPCTTREKRRKLTNSGFGGGDYFQLKYKITNTTSDGSCPAQ